MKRITKIPARRTPARRKTAAKPFVGRQYEITADRKGGLPIPDQMAQDMDIQIGDEYALWKEGEGWRIVFLKHAKPGVNIPRHAERRKVEPALPEVKPRLRRRGAEGLLVFLEQQEVALPPVKRHTMPFK